MENENIVQNEAPAKKILTREKKRLIFYILMISLPVLQICIFYIYLNFKSVLMSFEIYTEAAGTFGYDVTYSFGNFIRIINYIAEGTNYRLITNSLVMFVCSTIVGTSLALIFSYYVYKKFLFSGLFRVILFLPQIVSGLVLSIIFKFMVNDCYRILTFQSTGVKVDGLMENPDTVFLVVVLYNLWLGFGTNILMYSGAMASIDESVVESAHLDGVNTLQEFFYITMPMIFSTFTVYIVANFSVMLNQEMHLYSFYSGNCPPEIRTMGYLITASTIQSDLIAHANWFTYSELSALGLMITIVVYPIATTVKKLMEKYGPSFN